MGDGSWGWRSVPGPVSGLGSGVATIDTGGDHTCAVTTGGAVWCWGLNISGLPGDDRPLIRLTPVWVSGFAGAAPTVSGVAPPRGPVAGGTQVTITGTGFGTAATVTIGGVAATNVVVASATSITATTPAGDAGPAAVAVTTPGGTATLVAGFTYLAAPTVTGISPPAGSTSGGTAVTILGTGFVSGATVTIGGVAATNAVVWGATSITAATGPHGAGVADVVVTNVDGQGATLAGGFTYRAPPMAARPSRDFDGDERADVAVYRPVDRHVVLARLVRRQRRLSVSRLGRAGAGRHAGGRATSTATGWSTRRCSGRRPGTWFILESHAGLHDVELVRVGERDRHAGAGRLRRRRARPTRRCTGRRPGRGTSGRRAARRRGAWCSARRATSRSPGDFDGDGRRDIAVYRPASGTWFWLKSSSNFTAYDYRGWGVQAQGDVPAPGDYDGDGKTDLCVFRPASGHVVHPRVARGVDDVELVRVGERAPTRWCRRTTTATGRRTRRCTGRPPGQWFVRPSSGAAPWNVVFGQAGDLPVGSIR